MSPLCFPPQLRAFLPGQTARTKPLSGNRGPYGNRDNSQRGPVPRWGAKTSPTCDTWSVCAGIYLFPLQKRQGIDAELPLSAELNPGPSCCEASVPTAVKEAFVWVSWGCPGSSGPCQVSRLEECSWRCAASESDKGWNDRKIQDFLFGAVRVLT